MVSCVGAALALGAGFPSATPTALFAGAKTFPVGKSTYPIRVAIGDLNGDKKLDVVTANFAAKSISVLLGRGNGSLRANRSYPIGARPRSLAIGDLNGDQTEDLVAANGLKNTVSVLLGRGDGSLGPARAYATGSGPESVAIRDLNGDGKPDLATANPGADTISVLANKGDGSFDPARRFDVDVAHDVGDSLVIEDLNGDGVPDIATSILSGVAVILNNGNGTFETERDYEAGTNDTPSIAIGDLNRDGKPDLATANEYGTMSVLLNRGGGRFGAARDYRAEEGDATIALGDLNGDSKPDVVTANPDCCPPHIPGVYDSVSVFTNRGDGTFAGRREYQTDPYAHPGLGGRPESVAIGDLNGDQRRDLVTANSFGATVSVLINATGSCVVPNVRARALKVARQEIIRNACGVGKLRRAYSRRVAKGRVISERPRPGTVLPRHARVTLIVSRGRRS